MGGQGAEPLGRRKICKNFLKKIEKRIILAYFTQNRTNPALIFGAFGRNTQIVGKFFKKSLKI